MSNYEKDEMCEQCNYWLSGDCRLNPPVIISALVNPKNDDMAEEVSMATWWPKTNGGDWCGQFRLLRD